MGRYGVIDNCISGSGVRDARSIHKEMVIFFKVNMNKIKRLT